MDRSDAPRRERMTRIRAISVAIGECFGMGAVTLAVGRRRRQHIALPGDADVIGA
jgi:hypothetical protein